MAKQQQKTNQPVQVVEIRELLKLSPQELLNGLKTNLHVQFEDNVVEYLDYREIIMIRYLLQLFDSVKEYYIPITSKYILNRYYIEGIYTGKSLTKWVEVAMIDIIEIVVKPLDNRAILSKVHQQLWEVTNSIYNEVIFEKLKYCGTLSIEDLLEVQMDTNLLEAMKQVNIEQTPQSVNKTYEVLDNIIRHKPEIRNNQIVKGYLSESMNPNQVKQLLASRGYVTEINNRIFKYPVASSFTLGLQTLYDIAVDSRSAAKALFVSHEAIKQSEYFARVLQLVTMEVSKIVEEDCGTTDYMDFYVRTQEENNGKSDINNLIGLRFINPETGEEEVLTKEHKDLVEGKFIKLRTALSCKTKNPNHICKRCFGELSYSIPVNTNIGHYCSTEITEKISQSILSTKHLTSSATSGTIHLDDIAATMFTVKNNNYYIKSSLDRKKTRYLISISQDQAFGIKSIVYDNSFSNINPARLSRISNISVIVQNDNKEHIYPIPISYSNRYGIFTHEFLQYIVQNGYTLDQQFNYIIDLKNWKASMPIIHMPEIEYDFLSLIKEFRSKFNSPKTNDFGVYDSSPEVVLQECFELINNKLNINMAILAVIIYGFTVKDPENGNYSLGRFAEKPTMAKLDVIMKNRSLGASYGWERLKDIIFSPRSFDSHNAVAHPMDVIIKPQEVLMHNKSLDNI